MRILWTLLKVIIGLAIAIPVGIVGLVLTLGILGTLLGLAVLALKLVCVAFVGYGLFRLARNYFAPQPKPAAQPALARPDPYYDAAMRELNAEMGHTSGR